MSPHFYRVLFQISLGYSRPQGKLPMCYSPVCHADKSAFNLHALDTPPAFILSQDQTLIEKNDYSNLKNKQNTVASIHPDEIGIKLSLKKMIIRI